MTRLAVEKSAAGRVQSLDAMEGKPMIITYTVTAPDASFALLPDADAAVIATHDGAVVARCALWWSGNLPALSGRRVGILGQYESFRDDAAAPLLEHALAELARHGCDTAIGPMDGNTWRRYRLVTGDEDITAPAEPPFFLEPTNPHSYPGHFADAGFAPLATYSSRIATDLTYGDERAEKVAVRMADAGVTLSPVRAESIEDELRAIYKLSVIGFRDNFLYTPLPESEFFDSYRRIVPYLRPELSLMARTEDGTLAGFLFALPDLEEAKRGEPSRTFIVKTTAVLPGRQWAGLGMLLLDRCQSAARDAGFTRAVHALMHDSNASRNLSIVYGGTKTLRRYTLYGREL